ncbi:cation transporter [Clostridium sp. 1001275B_160808_H3]|uniref:cation transporter n=1 Tax=Clostridium sp. 1001275B_160808_H3 TaxID=2787110 RepID=UPI0018986F46|nr:cation transporter [Clostridium sp. 1001275B_160808_H3]
MIIFDGLYSFISVILSSASLVVCKVIEVKDNEDFPFGKYVLEPLVVSINSIILIIMCLLSLYDAINALLLGGNSVNTSSAIVYAIVSTLGSFIFYDRIKKAGKKINSELIDAESIQWLMDGILSATVLFGFILSAIISKTEFSFITKYIDPTMVIITSILFLKAPLKIFINSFKEVIGVRVPERISVEVEKQVEVIKNEYNFIQAVTRVLKIGRSVKIEVNFIIGENNQLITKEEEEIIKNELYIGIDSENYFKDMQIIFTTNKNNLITA